MAATGVSVTDEVTAQFAEFKKSSNKISFIIYKIEDLSKGPIVAEYTSGENEPFQSFLEKLPMDDCRYAIYNMDFTTTDGRPTNKLVNIAWAPDTARVKAKMVYAGSKAALDRVFVGVSTKITAVDLSDLTEEKVQEACRKFA